MAKLLLFLCVLIEIYLSNEASGELKEDTTGDSGNSSANTTNTFYDYDYTSNGALNIYEVVTDILKRYGLMIITVLALFGNALIIIVLTNKKNRACSTSMYLASLAVSDITAVLSSSFKSWLEQMYGVRIFFALEIECKVFLPLLYTTAMNSSWTLAVIAVERVISITVPHRVKIICSVHNAKRTLVGIWSAFLAFSIFLAIVFQPDETHDCMFINVYISFYAFDLSITTLAFLIPFVVILSATVIIVVQLLKRKKKNISSKGFDVLPITVTLIFTNIAFIATVMPINIVFMIYKIQGFLGVEQIGNINPFMNIFRFLLHSNTCLNFFIYFLSGSRFRAEVKELFSFCKKTTTVSKNSTAVKY